MENVQTFHWSHLLYFVPSNEVLVRLLLIVMMFSGHNISGVMVRMMIDDSAGCTFGPNSAEGEGDAHLPSLLSKPTQTTFTASINHTFFSSPF